MQWLTSLEGTFGPEGRLCLVGAVCATVVACSATPLARRLAVHLGAVDHPGGRKVHTRATARLGGPAILVGMVAGALIALATGWLPADAFATLATTLGIGALVCFFGAIDDMRPITPLGKILGLTMASCLLIVSGISIDFVTLPFFSRIEFGWFAIPATILWVLACTNAINLIDGVDGASSGVVMISGFTMMLLSLGLGDPTTALLFGVTAGAAAGFLIHNRQPASIFLGDSGSLLLGFMLAASSAAGCTKGATALTLVGALLALSVPLLDAVQSFVRRFRAALRHQSTRPVLAALKATAIADKGHIHHRLLFRGLSHHRVSLTLWLVTTVTSLSALMLLPTDRVHWVALLAVLGISAFVLFRLGSVELEKPPVEPRTEPPAGGPQGMGRPRRKSAGSARPEVACTR